MNEWLVIVKEDSESEDIEESEDSEDDDDDDEGSEEDDEGEEYEISGGKKSGKFNIIFTIGGQGNEDEDEWEDYDSEDEDYDSDEVTENEDESISLELTSKNIKIHSICPGFTRTEFHERCKQDVSGVPSIFWLKSEKIAKIAWKKANDGVVLSIPGLHYKGLVFLHRYAPRSIVRLYGRVAAKIFLKN